MKTLEIYREQINKLDEDLIALLGKRYKIVREVGQYKSRNNLSIVQSDRVIEVKNRVRALALKHNLDPDFIVKLYDEMIDHAHKIENGIKVKHDCA